MKIEPENDAVCSTAVQETVLKGISAAAGIEIGIALVVGNTPDQPHSFYETASVPISEQNVSAEQARFSTALEATRNEILQISDKVRASLDAKEASIFDAHLLIVEDKKLKNEVLSGIQEKLLTAESVFSRVMQRYITAISSVEDPYLKERAADVVDVAGRILGHLLGWKRALLDHLPGQRIIIARELTPSDTVMLDRENVQAFATETGAKTSHSAILA